MDVCELEKAVGKQSLRQPLVSADNKNGATRPSQTREVSSRYLSPPPPATSLPKRCPSPNARRLSSASNASLPKRAISTERKRPSTPSTPPSPSLSTAAVKASINKSPESLWPSTMRSLSVSFQADKKEKTIPRMPSDRTLKPSPNVARKGETPIGRKPTPDKRRSPLKGKNSADQLENSKPVDSLPHFDQHRWPSRMSGKTSSIPKRSDVSEQVNKTKNPISHSRRLSLDGASQLVHKSASGVLSPASSFHEVLQKLQRPSSSSSERASLMNAAARTRSLSIPKSRPSSPSVSRNASPLRGRIVTPSSRGSSPTRVRPSSPSRQPQDTTSVLSFISGIRTSKKAANDIEDVHQLRLFYNRYLQWQYANARTGAAMHYQKEKEEQMLYSVWRTVLDLSDSVRKKRNNLQQLKLKLKLYSVLVNQARWLDEWASIEKDHNNSLTSAIQDLQASTLRIPITDGTRVDIKSVKGAVCSAVDVMKAIGSSSYSILPQVEGMNSLVSKLSDVAARERAMLNECESLFVSIAALQVEEDSLRTHLLHKKQVWLLR